MPGIPISASTTPACTYIEARQHATQPFRSLPSAGRSKKLAGFSVSARAANSDTGLSDIGNLIKAATKEPSKPRSAQSPLKSPAVEQAASSAGTVGPAEQLNPVAQRSPSVTTTSESFGRVAEGSKEQLSDTKQAMSRAAEGSSPSSIPEAGKAAAKQPSPSFSSAPDAGSLSTPAQSAADATDAVTASVPEISPGDSNLGAPEGGLDSIRASVDNVKEGLLNQASDFQSSASQTMQDASEGLKEQVSGISSGLTKNLAGISEDASKQLEGVSETVGQQFKGLSDATGDALQGAAAQLDAARDAASDVVSSVGSQLGESAAGAIDNLPPPVRDALSAAAAPVSQALADPRIGLLLLGAGVSIPALLWFSARYGGYAGLLPPEKALDILETENSLLLDVRSEDSRLVSGTPDLRLAARSRAVALPLVQISRRTGTQVLKADVLPFQLAAVLVGGLSKVNRGTKIIILDESEGRAIKLARAISSEASLKAYVLQGGFRGWASARLPVKAAMDYDSSLLDSVNDTVQASILPSLRDPVLGTIAISLGITAVAAVYDVHRTLQFIGTFAVLATIGTVPVRYDNYQDAYNDLVGPFVGIASTVSRFLPKSRPSRGAPQVAGDSPQASSEEHAAVPVAAELLDDNEEVSFEGSQEAVDDDDTDLGQENEEEREEADAPQRAKTNA